MFVETAIISQRYGRAVEEALREFSCNLWQGEFRTAMRTCSGKAPSAAQIPLRRNQEKSRPETIPTHKKTKAATVSVDVDPMAGIASA